MTRKAAYKAAYVVDFDGTITTGDITAELAAYYGGQAFMEIEHAYRRREIPIREWLRRIAGVLPADLSLLLNRALLLAEIRSGFASFLDHAREMDAPVYIASDGFGFYIEPVLEHYGLLDRITQIYRNETVENGAGGLRVHNPHRHPQCTVCGNCKAAHVVRIKDTGRPVIYIGDGSNDRFGASWGDYVCARDELLDFCRDYPINYSSWYDFYDIIKVEAPRLNDRFAASLCLPSGRGIK